MIAPRAWWVATAPIDLRCGIDRLLVLVQTALGLDGFDGSAYVFRNRSGTRLKVLCVDAQGVWLCTRWQSWTATTRVRSHTLVDNLPRNLGQHKMPVRDPSPRPAAPVFTYLRLIYAGETPRRSWVQAHSPRSSAPPVSPSRGA